MQPTTDSSSCRIPGSAPTTSSPAVSSLLGPSHADQQDGEEMFCHLQRNSVLLAATGARDKAWLETDWLNQAAVGLVLIPPYALGCFAIETSPRRTGCE